MILGFFVLFFVLYIKKQEDVFERKVGFWFYLDFYFYFCMLGIFEIIRKNFFFCIGLLSEGFEYEIIVKLICLKLGIYIE